MRFCVFPFGPFSMGKIISKKELAELIGKSERWITNLIDEGLPVAAGGGKGVALQIDSEAAINWLIKREVTREVGDDDDEDGEGKGAASTEDRLLKRARRQKLQIEIDVAYSRLVPAETAAFFLTTIAAVFATQLDSVASRLASELAVINEPSLVRARIFEEMRRIRAATSDQLDQRARELVAQIGQLRLGGGEPSDGAAPEDG